MAEIKDIRAREILDSRGNPTIEADVILSSGIIGRASVPSGASTGSKEAIECRDGGKRFGGKGVLTAIEHVETDIKKALLGHDVRYQKGIDTLLINLDGTPNKKHLGANAVLAVSLACVRAAALSIKLPLYEYIKTQEFSKESHYLMPVPLVNIINGGAHADNNLEIQEFMIIPAGVATFKEAIQAAAEIFHALKSILKQKKFNTTVGDEGGFAPSLSSNEVAIELIMQAIELSGYKAGQEVFLGLDLASNEFYSDGKYHFKSENKRLNTDEFVNYLKNLVNHYPFLSIEDPMAENDIEGWILLTKELSSQIQIVGDDLFVTNSKILEQGVQNAWANAVLIKPNQIGTLTETFSTIKMAKTAHFGTIVSHRSGETEDTFIADLAVASGCGQIKTGSVSRTDRTAKYNQLLRIEEALGSKAHYAGRSIFDRNNTTGNRTTSI